MLFTVVRLNAVTADKIEPTLLRGWFKIFDPTLLQKVVCSNTDIYVLHHI